MASAPTTQKAPSHSVGSRSPPAVSAQAAAAGSDSSANPASGRRRLIKLMDGQTLGSRHAGATLRRW